MGLVKSSKDIVDDMLHRDGFLTESELRQRHSDFVEGIIASGHNRHPALLPISQVAYHCKVTHKQINAWVRKGWLDFGYTPGGHRRFLIEDVETAIKRQLEENEKLKTSDHA